MPLEFEESTHTYRFDGRVVPSVTQILSDAGMVDKQWFTEEGRDRGRAVHIITELHDKGTLIESKVPEDLQPYLRAWRKFLYDTKAQVIECERMVYCPLYGYAGTIDRLLLLNDEECLPDIKGHCVAPHEPIQTAAYAHCLGKVRPVNRCTVHLLPTGKYRKYVHTREDFRRDFDRFRAALVVAQYRREHIKECSYDRDGR